MAADPNRVIFTGENHFIRLSETDTDEYTSVVSFWRIVLCPDEPNAKRDRARNEESSTGMHSLAPELEVARRKHPRPRGAQPQVPDEDPRLMSGLLVLTASSSAHDLKPLTASPFVWRHAQICRLLRRERAIASCRQLDDAVSPVRNARCECRYPGIATRQLVTNHVKA